MEHERLTIQELTPHRHEVVVVGARCAGAATAMLLARRGHDVPSSIEPSSPATRCRPTPSPAAAWSSCTAGACSTDVLDAVRRRSARSCSTAAARRSRGRSRTALGVDMLVAPRRHVLDAILLDAAGRAGARAADRRHRRRSATAVRRPGDRRLRPQRPPRVRHRRARFVVGADGRRLARSPAPSAPVTEVAAAGGATHYAYFAGDWPAIEYTSATDVRRRLPDAQRRGLRLGLRAGRTRRARLAAGTPTIDAAFDVRWSAPRHRPWPSVSNAAHSMSATRGSSACPTTFATRRPGVGARRRRRLPPRPDHRPRHQRRLPRRRTAGDRARLDPRGESDESERPRPATTPIATACCERSSRSPASWPLPAARPLRRAADGSSAAPSSAGRRCSPPARLPALVAA